MSEDVYRFDYIIEPHRSVEHLHGAEPDGLIGEIVRKHGDLKFYIEFGSSDGEDVSADEPTNDKAWPVVVKLHKKRQFKENFKRKFGKSPEDIDI